MHLAVVSLHVVDLSACTIDGGVARREGHGTVDRPCSAGQKKHELFRVSQRILSHWVSPSWASMLSFRRMDERKGSTSVGPSFPIGSVRSVVVGIRPKERGRTWVDTHVRGGGDDRDDRPSQGKNTNAGAHKRGGGARATSMGCCFSHAKQVVEEEDYEEKREKVNENNTTTNTRGKKEAYEGTTTTRNVSDEKNEDAENDPC